MSESVRTSYGIYNESYKKRIVQNPLLDIFPPLPNKKYAVIYADPPWHYNGKMQFDRSGVSSENPDWKRDIFISSACFKYPTLPTKDLMKLPIETIAKDDALLFMWSTNPHLEQAISLGKAWGFDYKTVAFVWNKMNHNPGQYTLSYCELCLLFKRGRIPRPRGARNVKQILQVPRKMHSQKPEEIANRIDQMFPQHKKIELFARATRENWDLWGLDQILKNNSNLEEV
ncbi:MAG: MT-A70 family methyltransferase [Flavobacteriaceae bacterium]|nr:MT-A70 family methyltransferase [Flavobacteriaceae bacterium]